MVIFETLVGCHDNLILGKRPIKWRLDKLYVIIKLKHTGRAEYESLTSSNSMRAVLFCGSSDVTDDLLRPEVDC